LNFRYDCYEFGGLSTAGDLVFGGGHDGDLVALDANAGAVFWSALLVAPTPAD
jgi:hypothetical protein